MNMIFPSPFYKCDVTFPECPLSSSISFSTPAILLIIAKNQRRRKEAVEITRAVQEQENLFPLRKNIAGSGVFYQMLTNSVRAKFFTGML